MTALRRAAPGPRILLPASSRPAPGQVPARSYRETHRAARTDRPPRGTAEGARFRRHAVPGDPVRGCRHGPAGRGDERERP
ncbi:hypothetical protein DDW44_02545 [Streptomyces tirandamycinicus]|uniref:Uncharacterized protein n=1 Tax=Streptomyces tirandamycinicus TaxID=2174846 RepID=A0A2S1SN00_9ACTN|nr:hypothetical protein DDW44_02545 [Streptomyces tirandamycinicus]